MTKTILSFIVLLAAILAAASLGPPVANAHRDGCHRWHSCPSDTGSYVCGDLGYYSECPGGAPAPKVSTPTAPVITIQTLATDEIIDFKATTKWTNKEYRGYSKVLQKGVHGVRRVYTEVTYTAGAETSRVVTKTETVTQPIPEIVSKGKRTKPSAKITAIRKTDSPDKFDITGRYRTNAEVVLALDGKRIKRAKTDNKGNFIFKGIKLKGKKHAVEIYKRVKSKENKVSEKYEVLPAKRQFLSEYDKLHNKSS